MDGQCPERECAEGYMGPACQYGMCDHKTRYVKAKFEKPSLESQSNHNLVRGALDMKLGTKAFQYICRMLIFNKHNGFSDGFCQKDSLPFHGNLSIKF